jgi:Fe-S cluster biogenesis protein NfuA
MTASSNNKTRLIERVEKSLDTIRPYLQADGGNIRVVDITNDMVVRLKLLGNCESCPMSYMTMKTGVEDAIKKAVPEVQAVETV